jgi:formate--tetrahydrofolate ligase
MSVQVGTTVESVELTYNSIKTASKPRLSVALPVSPVGMEYTCHKKAPKMIELIKALVEKSVSLCSDVEFVALDATRAESDVLVATIKALKYHGGVPKDLIFEKNDEALIKGFENLDKHYENLKKFGVNVVVCLNKFGTDTEEDIELLRKHCEEKGYLFSVSTAYVDGGKGAYDLANTIIDLPKADFKCLYELDSSLVDKINTVCKEIYGAKKVNISEEALKKIEVFNENGMGKLPICVAKTQYSFSDDKSLVGVPKDFDVTVRDINIYNGAGFVTVLLGDIMTMPGLSRKPNCELIDVIDGEIVNLS